MGLEVSFFQQETEEHYRLIYADISVTENEQVVPRINETSGMTKKTVQVTQVEYLVHQCQFDKLVSSKWNILSWFDIRSNSKTKLCTPPPASVQTLSLITRGSFCGEEAYKVLQNLGCDWENSLLH